MNITPEVSLGEGRRIPRLPELDGAARGEDIASARWGPVRQETIAAFREASITSAATAISYAAYKVTGFVFAAFIVNSSMSTPMFALTTGVGLGAWCLGATLTINAMKRLAKFIAHMRRAAEYFNTDPTVSTEDDALTISARMKSEDCTAPTFEIENLFDEKLIHPAKILHAAAAVYDRAADETDLSRRCTLLLTAARALGSAHQNYNITKMVHRALLDDLSLLAKDPSPLLDERLAQGLAALSARVTEHQCPEPSTLAKALLHIAGRLEPAQAVKVLLAAHRLADWNSLERATSEEIGIAKIQEISDPLAARDAILAFASAPQLEADSLPTLLHCAREIRPKVDRNSRAALDNAIKNLQSISTSVRTHLKTYIP